MNTLSLSAATQDKQFKLSTQRTSNRVFSAFKTTSRQKKASWGNRFTRDFNDLNYDINYTLIKGKQSFKDISKKNIHLKRNVKSANSKKSSSFTRPVSSPTKSSNYQKNIKRQQLIKMNKVNDPQQYSIKQKQIYSTLQTSGLCKHQFQKTIKGKLTFKTNHHMQFQHQTQRNKNLNPVWYNPQDQLDLQKMLKNINLSKIQKCHPFPSYTDRKVFVPRKQLDKFYDTKKQKQKCSPQKIKQIVEIGKVSGRKNMKKKITTNLQYDEYHSRKRSIQPKITTYQITKSERAFKFSPQVINANRGCYR